jgi:hypothetical protein
MEPAVNASGNASPACTGYAMHLCDALPLQSIGELLNKRAGDNCYVCAPVRGPHRTSDGQTIENDVRHAHARREDEHCPRQFRSRTSCRPVAQSRQDMRLSYQR